MARILIVDDEREICDLAAFKLGRQGHTIHTANNGDAGLAVALEVTPDLMLLDWMMPRMTGLEMCHALRESRTFAATPIILLTARAQESDIERALSAGATDYIIKPFSPRELVVRVEAALGYAPTLVS
jgi:two-component system phosphate regulon response regulator PhoB